MVICGTKENNGRSGPEDCPTARRRAGLSPNGPSPSSLLLFGTTTLVQAFVIPTGSMEDTLLIGDHLLVDKLAYAPGGPVSANTSCPTAGEARRHHRIPLSRRYQADLREALHGRSRRPHPARQQAGLSERQEAGRAVRYHKTDYIDSYRDNFPSEPKRAPCPDPGNRHVGASRGERRSGGAGKQLISRWATTAIHRSTAAIGDSCRARISSASRSSFTGPTMRPQVKRGDIIVFRSPADLNMTLVKRCMGVPGDRIRLVDKQVYLNGRKLDEPYVRHITEFIDPYRDEFPGVPDMQVTPTGVDMLEHHVIDGEVVVPPDHYFAMGDNRDNSLDSRYWGFVPHDNIVGKPVLVYWSYDAPSEALLNPTVGVDHLIDMTEHFFSKTRWRRTFLLVHGYPVN
jgi:signal peptidase I